MPYFHVVYTLPAAIRDIAYQNKAVIYDLLFKASADPALVSFGRRPHCTRREHVVFVRRTSEPGLAGRAKIQDQGHTLTVCVCAT